MLARAGARTSTHRSRHPPRVRRQLDLSGPTALVTGSTGDIGRAIAADLALACARVMVTGRTTDRVDAAVTDRRDATGGELVGVAADVATADEAAAVAEAEQAADVDSIIP